MYGTEVLFGRSSPYHNNEHTPVFMEEPLEHCPELIEKLCPPSRIFTRSPVILIRKMQYPVIQKGKEVQKAEHLACILLPVAEIVFQIVPVIFQHISMLILYLPAGAAACAKQHDIVFPYLFVCHPTVTIGDFTFFFVGYLQG